MSCSTKSTPPSPAVLEWTPSQFQTDITCCPICTSEICTGVWLCVCKMTLREQMRWNHSFRLACYAHKDYNCFLLMGPTLCCCFAVANTWYLLKHCGKSIWKHLSVQHPPLASTIFHLLLVNKNNRQGSWYAAAQQTRPSRLHKLHRCQGIKYKEHTPVCVHGQRVSENMLLCSVAKGGTTDCKKRF